MGLEDLDVVVYNVGSGSAKVAASSDVRRDKGIVIDDSSKRKKVGAAIPMEPAEASKAVGDSEALRSEKRKDREDDRRRSGSDPKKSKKEMRKDKGLIVSEVANVERPNLEERNAKELVGDQTAMVSNVNFMRTRYEQMLQKNHELIQENRSLKSKMRNMTKSAEEMVGHINTLGQKNEELKVEVAKWEDEVQSMMGEKESLYHLAKSQMKRLRLSREDTATSFGEYAIEKVGAGLQEKVGAQLQRIRRHIDDSREMNRISSTVGQIKAFLSFYEEQGSAPEGAVEKLKEDLEKYLKMAATHNVEKVAEQDFVFPDRSDWIPDDELVFSLEVMVRPTHDLLESFLKLVALTRPCLYMVARERMALVSETDEDEEPLAVDDRAKVSKGPSEVAGTSTKADERPCTTADLAANPDEAAERLETDEVDIVNF
ncbi:hypothetical protein AALP_AA8G317900 [Arabis alpina]|uniref:DUF1204 domain-containing protein n=1 Tax=Arabis alpina TaxID=50452 RepID=A0A087GAS5_ARAAL|nr:hypothetical protein AALP_AA8G317900 [Arabis alpina]